MRISSLSIKLARTLLVSPIVWNAYDKYPASLEESQKDICPSPSGPYCSYLHCLMKDGLKQPPHRLPPCPLLHYRPMPSLPAPPAISAGSLPRKPEAPSTPTGPTVKKDSTLTRGATDCADPITEAFNRCSGGKPSHDSAVQSARSTGGKSTWLMVTRFGMEPSESDSKASTRRS